MTHTCCMLRAWLLFTAPKPTPMSVKATLMIARPGTIWYGILLSPSFVELVQPTNHQKLPATFVRPLVSNVEDVV